MTVPITMRGSNDLASTLWGSLKSAHTATLTAQADNNADKYNSVVNIPSHNKRLQDAITAVQNSGDVVRVVAQLNERLPSDITISDVTSFASALDSFATAIANNAALFLLSINATTKAPEFVTPVSAGIKTEITNRINAVLSEVS